MIFIVCLFLFAAQAFAATTKHHHTAHPPTTPTQSAEQQVLTFKFDPHTNIMMAMVGHNKCYLYTVSGTEATDVHTPHGLHTLEIKMIKAIDDSTAKHTTITHDDLLAASKSLAHACSNTDAHVFKLN